MIVIMRRVLHGVLAIAICIATLAGCANMKFDQTTDKDDLLTEKYQISQIEQLQGAMEAGDVTFSNFKKDFAVQCMRRTHQGYYVVLLLEDGRNVFAFFDEENTLKRVMAFDRFRSKEEFQNRVVEQTPQSEVLNWDLNAIMAPVSALEITAHIVQEGVFVVKYSRFRNGEIIEDPIVTSIKFLDNESLAAGEDPLIQSEIPYILPMDKKD